MNHPTDRITHTTTFVTPVVENWLEREIAQWVQHEGSMGHDQVNYITVGRGIMYDSNNNNNNNYNNNNNNNNTFLNPQIIYQIL